MVLYPEELGAPGAFPAIQWIYVSFNDLTGQIPPSLGNLTTLTRLSLAENNLCGPIPATFANLVNMERLWLQNSNLSGPIPTIYDSYGSSFEFHNLSGNKYTFADMLPVADFMNSQSGDLCK